MRKEILLDNDAQALFEQLGGIDMREGGGQPSATSQGLDESLLEEEGRMDEWRILLVELLYLLTGFFSSVRLTGLTRRHEEDMESLLAMMRKLSQVPSQDRELLIRYRGGAFSMSQGKSDDIDYVMTCGALMADLSVIKALANRKGITLSHLPGRLLRAFELLSSMEINTIHITLPTGNASDIKRLKDSFYILVRYFMALSIGKASPQQRDQANGTLAIVLNENGQADPNLTLLAALNGLNREGINGLVQKVASMMNQPGLEQYANVFGALFAFKNLRDKLIRPPLELNNVRWMMVEKNSEVMSREKAQIARNILKKFGDSPEVTGELMQGIYGTDFEDIEANALERRLDRVEDFLETMEGSEDYSTVEKEVIENIEKRLDQVPESILDELPVKEPIPEETTKEEETIKDKLHGKLSEMVTFFKRRSKTKKKMREMIHQAIDFDDQDYQTIARDFEIAVPEAQDLLQLLKSCFDKQGRFLRGAFDKNIPAFARYEKKVFDFLWHYLKELKIREDRVAFLNSLQSLIAHMKHRQKAIQVLVNDLIHQPEALNFSDRNTLILINSLLRKDFQVRTHDVEITPEEVLLLRDDLDRELVVETGRLVDEEQEKFFQKIRSIHKELKEALDSPNGDGEQMPIRFLVTLEREFYIFLSLIGGMPAQKVLRSFLMEFGDPDAEIYRFKKSPGHVRELLQLLQVAIRGIGRIGEQGDLSLLDKISEQEALFMNLIKGSQNKSSLKRVMEWVDAAKGLISSYSLN